MRQGGRKHRRDGNHIWKIRASRSVQAVLLVEQGMSTLVERASERIASLRERRDAIEAGRRVPAALADELAAEGYYRMLVPAAYGGGQVRARVFAEALETLALGDSAAAWTMMTGSTTGVLAAYLPASGAEAIFRDPAGTYAGVFAPMATATLVEGGYRVTGRWPFASGVENASWRLGGARVVDSEGAPKMRTTPDGREVPEVRSFFFPDDETRVHDTWDTGGLRGTGSHDLSVDDVFVPAERSASVFDGPVVDAPLYRLPLFGLLAAGIAAVGLGVARDALDHMREVAGRARRVGKPLGASELAQVHLARAAASLGAARRYLLGTLEDIEAHAEQGRCGDEDRVALRLAAAHAARSCAEVVDRMHTLAGGAAVYRRNPIERHFRDIHTLTQHVMVAEKTWRPLGRYLAGLPTDTSQL